MLNHIINFNFFLSLRYNYFVQRLFLLKNLSNNYPSTLNIELTNNCNLDCVFCPRKFSNRSLGLISPLLFKKIIDGIKRSKSKLWTIWLMKDGEPLIHPHLAEFIAYIKGKNITRQVEIYSNGILLNEENTKKIIFSGLDSMIISLDAVDRKGYEIIKGKDEYKKVTDNVILFMKIKKKLNKNKPLLSVKIIDNGKNKKDIYKFKKLWSEKVDNVLVQKMHNWEGSVNLTKKKDKKRYPCNLPWLSPAVNWNGKVTSCCINYKKNELMMGDLSSQGLKKIWCGQKYKELRKAHLEGNLEKFPTCQHCDYWQQLPNMKFWLEKISK